MANGPTKNDPLGGETAGTEKPQRDDAPPPRREGGNVVGGDARFGPIGNAVFDMSPEAVSKMFDSTIIGSALATGLTEQIKIEFDKEGGLIKKLAGGGVGAITEALRGLAIAQEKYTNQLINSAQSFRRGTGGAATPVEPFEQLQTGREFVGGSLAELGIKPEDVLSNLKEIGSSADSLARLLDKNTTPKIATFQQALKELGVEGVGLNKFQNLVKDLEKEDAPKLVERFKQLTAVALGLSKETGQNLNKSFQTVFEEANKLTTQGIFDFDRLQKAIVSNANAATKLGISVPGSLNKVLPSFREVFGVAKNLGAALKGFTIDPKSFLNQTGAQRLESIFQSFRKAQEAGTFQVEEAGLGRDQQAAFLTKALQGTGLDQREVQRLLQLLDQGTTTLTGSEFEVPTGDEAQQEVQRRAKDTRSREQIQGQIAQDQAQEAALGTAGGRAQAANVLQLVISDVDKITEERQEALKKFGDAILKSTTEFARIATLANAFEGKEGGPATFRGIIAYSVLGPENTFENTIGQIREVGTEVNKLFETLASPGASNFGKGIQDLANNPAIKDLKNETEKLKEAGKAQAEALKKKFDAEVLRLQGIIQEMEKKIEILRGQLGLGDAGTLNPGATRDTEEDARRVGAAVANGLNQAFRTA